MLLHFINLIYFSLGLNDAGNRHPRRSKVKGQKTREVKAKIPLQQPTVASMRPLGEQTLQVRKGTTQVKVHGPVRPCNGPVWTWARDGPLFRSLNISTFQGLKNGNGPIIYTGPLQRARYYEPVITG